ncbi:MAG: glycosyltransferase family 39 protein, partial [Phycisphaerae bacterium]
MKPLAPALMIAAAFIAMLVWTWRAWPDPLIDFGRELYVAWRLAAGDVLYRDAAHFLGPLSPQLNALWFRLFGSGLLTLALANVALAALFTALLYRLLRRVADPFAAAAACIVFVKLLAFGQYVPAGNYNFACPYTHEAVHGLILATTALWTFARYLERRRLIDLAATGVLTGLTLLTRAEPFVALTAALFVGFLADRSRTPDSSPGAFSIRAAALVGGALAPLIASLAIFGLQMEGSAALRGTFGAVVSSLGSDVTSLPFFRDSMGVDQPMRRVETVVQWSAVWAAVFLAASLAAAMSRGAKWRRAPIVCAGFVMPAALLAWYAGVADVPWLDMWRPLPIAMAVIIAAAWWASRRGDGDADAGRRRVLALTLAVFALVLLGKIILKARVHHYGFTLAAPSVALVVVAMLDWIPAGLSRRGLNGPIFRAAALGVLVVCVAGHLRITHFWLEHKTVTVGEGRDAFRSDPRGRAVLDALVLIDQHVGKNQTLAVLPEGAMWNYLARRSSSTPYVHFMPTELAIYGEDRLLAAFETAPPDVVLLVHKDTSEFGYRFFGRDYARRLGAWITERYRPVALLGAPPLRDERFGMMLMRRAS